MKLRGGWNDKRYAGGFEFDHGLCDWCRGPRPSTLRADARFCGRKCRQSAWRLRGRSSTSDASKGDRQTTAPLRFAYADPPYPGTAARYYRNEATYAGEVDHAKLVASLRTSGYAGWALSTSARALREILPLCPPRGPGLRLGEAARRPAGDLRAS